MRCIPPCKFSSLNSKAAPFKPRIFSTPMKIPWRKRADRLAPKLLKAGEAWVPLPELDLPSLYGYNQLVPRQIAMEKVGNHEVTEAEGTGLAPRTEQSAHRPHHDGDLELCPIPLQIGQMPRDSIHPTIYLLCGLGSYYERVVDWRVDYPFHTVVLKWLLGCRQNAIAKQQVCVPEPNCWCMDPDARLLFSRDSLLFIMFHWLIMSFVLELVTWSMGLERSSCTLYLYL